MFPVVCVPEPEQRRAPGRARTRALDWARMITATASLPTMPLPTDCAKDIQGRRVPKKLYVSRSGLPTGRGNLIGEARAGRAPRRRRLRHLSPRKAYDICAARSRPTRPRKHDRRGRGLRACIWWPWWPTPPPKSRSIVRRPSGATRNLERHLEAFAGRRPRAAITHLLTRSWKPIGAAAKPRLWMGELDMPALQDALAKEAGFIARERRHPLGRRSTPETCRNGWATGTKKSPDECVP